MQNGIALRSLQEQDGPALAGLSYSSVDGGFIQYAANYQIDAFRAVKAIHRDMLGVAACARDHSRLVGMGLVRFGQAQVEGAVRPYALLGNLIVHPDYRGQGLAARLVEWQVEKAREKSGPDTVIVTNFQAGNHISHRMYTRWLDKSTGMLDYLPLRTDSHAPPAVPGVSAGPLDESEFVDFAENHNAFYSGSNFFEPLSAASLTELTSSTPLQSPFRHAYAAVDPSGRLLAGLVVMEEFRLKQMEVRALPKTLQVLNNFLGMIPKDGAVREIFLDHIWYAPGQANAARHLVDTVRWIWAGRATNIAVLMDPNGPLSPVFPTRPWTVKARTHMLYHAPVAVDPRKPICPIF
jgi:predicted N-acetyltransferase YhbS